MSKEQLTIRKHYKSPQRYKNSQTDLLGFWQISFSDSGKDAVVTRKASSPLVSERGRNDPNVLFSSIATFAAGITCVFDLQLGVSGMRFDLRTVGFCGNCRIAETSAFKSPRGLCKTFGWGCVADRGRKREF